MILNIIPPVLLSIAFIYNSANNNIKKTRTNNVYLISIRNSYFWKMQFMLHPVIVFVFLFYASIRSTYSSSVFLSLTFVPFLFNWGVEPWDIPKDVYFQCFFYIHHLSPLIQMLFLQIENQKIINNSPSLIIELSSSSTSSTISTIHNLAIPLIYAHIWLLHTIGYLDRLKYIDKQNWFWQYIIQGFVLNLFYWYVYMRNVKFPSFLSWSNFPIICQYIGRWGLYISIQQLSKKYDLSSQQRLVNGIGYHDDIINRTNDNQYSNDGMTSNDNNNNISSIKKKKKETKDSKSHEDTFEENKQKYEAIGLICSYLCIYCLKYYINVVVFVISYGILQFYIEW